MKTLVPEEKCLTATELLAYAEDRLGREAVRAIDAHLTICPLCSDALEGVLATPQYGASLAALSEKIAAYQPPVVAETRRLSLWRSWQVAASVALLASVGYYFWPKKNTPVANYPPTEMAATTPATDTPPQYAPLPPPSNNMKADLKVSDKDLAVVTAPLEAKPAAALPTAPSAAPLNLPPLPTTESSQSEMVDTDTGVSEEAAEADIVSSQNRVESASKIGVRESNLGQNRNTNNNARVLADKPVAVAESTKKARVRRESDYSKGIEAYDNKDYTGAIAAFESFLDKNTSGTSYENALWFLANAYRAKGDTTAAKILLQRIVIEKGRWSNDAEVLLQKLK